MFGAVYHAFGAPRDVLKKMELPAPQAGPGQVRVKTLLSVIHNHDLITIQGNYGYRPTLPAVGGSEAVGVIDALGEGVSGFAIGQRVAASGLQGAWAEYFVATPHRLVPLPAGVTDEAAAQLMSMPLSALCVLEFVEAKAGQWLIQNAATGAVAKVLAMVAKRRGIHVVNLVRRQTASQELAALGIDNVISTESSDWRDQVKILTQGAPISAAIDGVAGPEGSELMSLLGDNGVFVSFGAMSGKPLQFSPGDLILKQTVVKGFWLSKIMETMPRERIGALVGELLGLVVRGDVKLQVGGVFDLDHIADAVIASEKSGRPGKILIRP